MTAPVQLADLAELATEHLITVESWSHSRVVLLCSCQVEPLSHRQVETDSGTVTIDDADGLTLRELVDMATAHLAEAGR